MANAACPDAATAEKVVNEVWESCFNDTRPFDEVSSCLLGLYGGSTIYLVITVAYRLDEASHSGTIGPCLIFQRHACQTGTPNKHVNSMFDYVIYAL